MVVTNLINRRQLTRLAYPWLMFALDNIGYLLVDNYAQTTTDLSTVYWLNLVVTLLVLMSHVLILKHFQKQLFSHWKPRLRQVLVALALFFLAQCCRQLIIPLINYKGTASFLTALNQLTGHPWTQVLLVLDANVIGPISEELICRAGLMDSYFKQSPYYLDVVFSAAVFAAVHLIGQPWSWLGFLFYLIPGLALAMAYRYSKMIYIPITMHISWNTLADLWTFFH